MEHKFEIAARMRTSNEFSHNSGVQELTLAKCTYTHYGDYSESLEVDRGRN